MIRALFLALPLAGCFNPALTTGGFTPPTPKPSPAPFQDVCPPGTHRVLYALESIYLAGCKKDGT